MEARRLPAIRRTPLTKQKLSPRAQRYSLQPRRSHDPTSGVGVNAERVALCVVFGVKLAVTILPFSASAVSLTVAIFRAMKLLLLILHLLTSFATRILGFPAQIKLSSLGNACTRATQLCESGWGVSNFHKGLIWPRKDVYFCNCRLTRPPRIGPRAGSDHADPPNAGRIYRGLCGYEACIRRREIHSSNCGYFASLFGLQVNDRGF